MRGALTDLKRTWSEAVIIGMGPSKEDIIKNYKFAEYRDVALVNRAGYEWKWPAKWWVTYHAECLERWWFKREAMGYPMEGMTSIVSANKRVKLGNIPNFNITAQVRGLNMGGTSSLCAAMVLLDMGYERVHLFGVDLDGMMRSKDRKFWKILKGEALVFHGDDWFHRGQFMEVE